VTDPYLGNIVNKWISTCGQKSAIPSFSTIIVGVCPPKDMFVIALKSYRRKGKRYGRANETLGLGFE